MNAARQPHHLPHSGRQGLRRHGATRRHYLRQKAGPSLPARRRQGIDMRMISAVCRILVRARFDLDALS